MATARSTLDLFDERENGSANLSGAVYGIGEIIDFIEALFAYETIDKKLAEVMDFMRNAYEKQTRIDANTGMGSDLLQMLERAVKDTDTTFTETGAFNGYTAAFGDITDCRAAKSICGGCIAADGFNYADITDICENLPASIAEADSAHCKIPHRTVEDMADSDWFGLRLANNVGLKKRKISAGLYAGHDFFCYTDKEPTYSAGTSDDIDIMEIWNREFSAMLENSAEGVAN